jgi:hypothetical protein
VFPELWQRLPELWQRLPELWQAFPELWQHLPELWQRLPELWQHLPELWQHFPELWQALPERWECLLKCWGSAAESGFTLPAGGEGCPLEEVLPVKGGRFFLRGWAWADGPVDLLQSDFLSTFASKYMNRFVYLRFRDENIDRRR